MALILNGLHIVLTWQALLIQCSLALKPRPKANRAGAGKEHGNPSRRNLILHQEPGGY